MVLCNNFRTYSDNAASSNFWGAGLTAGLFTATCLLLSSTAGAGSAAQLFVGLHGNNSVGNHSYTETWHFVAKTTWIESLLC